MQNANGTRWYYEEPVKEQPKVYLLIEQMMDGMAIHGTFSCPEKAEAYAEAHNARQPWYREVKFVVREHSLDPALRG